MKKTENNKLMRAQQTEIFKRSADNSAMKPNVLKHNFKLENNCSEIRSVNVCPNDRYLIITNAWNSKIRVVDLERLEYKKHAYNGHWLTVRLTSFTPDGQYFYTGSWDSTARKYHLESGTCLETYKGFFGRCPSVFVDPKQRYLFLASYDADLDTSLNNCGWCVELATKRVINKFPHVNTRERPEAIDIAYDQKHVFTGSDDGVAIKWELLSGKPVLQYFSIKGYTIRKIAVSRKYFAAGSSDGRIRVFTKQSGKPVVEFVHSYRDEVRDVKISADQTRLFSASADGTLMSYDLVNHKRIFHTTVHSKPIWSICLMAADKTLVSGSCDGTVAFTSDKGEVLARLMNLANNAVLLESPPDKSHPNGFFYTTDEKLVNVYRQYIHSDEPTSLPLDDLNRIQYCAQHNKKHLIMTKLKNDGGYNKLTMDHMKRMEILKDISGFKFPPLLDS